MDLVTVGTALALMREQVSEMINEEVQKIEPEDFTIASINEV